MADEEQEAHKDQEANEAEASKPEEAAGNAAAGDEGSSEQESVDKDSKAEQSAEPASTDEAPAENAEKDSKVEQSAEPASTDEAPAESAEKDSKTEQSAEPASTEAPADKASPEDSAKKEDEPKRERTAADVLLELDGPEAEGKQKVLKSKSSKNVHSGIVHILATFNNTVVTVSDQKGNVIGWSTSGKMGFRGSRKSTAYAAQVVSQDACKQAMAHGLKEAEVRVKGPGSGRESAVRAVQGIGIEVRAIRDVTPMPHNGCRPKKARRV
jgi:small subunit ribosomal protein S11